MRRQLAKAVTDITRELEKLETARIVDGSLVRSKRKVDEHLRKAFQLADNVTELDVETKYIVMSAPNSVQTQEIQSLIRDRLITVENLPPEEAAAAAAKLEAKFLNFPKTSRLLQTYRMEIPGRQPEKWILAFNTDQVMEREVEGGIALSSLNYAGFETIKFADDGYQRYHHLLTE